MGCLHHGQNLTYKYDTPTERIKTFIMAVDPYIGVQIKRKELTKTFMVSMAYTELFRSYEINNVFHL